MFNSAFKFRPSAKENCSCPCGKNLFEKVDQFCSTDFFVNEHGRLLSPISVMMRADASDELREKMQEYLIKKDVNGFDSSVSDDEVFDKLQSRYDTRSTLLSRMKAKIVELRSMTA